MRKGKYTMGALPNDVAEQEKAGEYTEATDSWLTPIPLTAAINPPKRCALNLTPDEPRWATHRGACVLGSAISRDTDDSGHAT